MLILLASLAGLFMLWLMFRLATYALPFGAGIWTALWLLHHDNGYLISVVAGFALGVCVLVAGQILFDTVRSPLIRLLLAAIFALPAGVAGYNLVYNLGRLAANPGIGLTILSWIGGAAVAIAASKHLAASPFVTDV